MNTSIYERRHLLKCLFVSAFIFIVTECSTAPVHEPSAPTQPATRDGRFERKVKCAGYFNQFKEELLADDNPEFTSSFLDELFYSPTLDTCGAAFHIDYLKAPVGPDVVYMLEDALSHKILFDFSIKKDAKAEGKWIAKRGELAQ